jgi:DNA repair protein RadD
MAKPIKVYGFTATPYRLDQMYTRTKTGEILTHTTTKLINRTKGRFWHRIMYNINSEDLMKEGYLVPLKYIDKSIIEHSEIPTNISKSDFDLEKYEKILEEKSDNILEAVYFGMKLAKSVLVFCSSVKQASHLCDLVANSAVVTAKTTKKDRTRIIKEFREGKIQTVFNVGVLTIGFDHPELGCIVLLRPTRSIGLYYQMLGRGVRPAEGKDHCKVIDMTGTVKQLGKIETIKLVKRNMWELESEKGSWHRRILYSFLIKERV